MRAHQVKHPSKSVLRKRERQRKHQERKEERMERATERAAERATVPTLFPTIEALARERLLDFRVSDYVSKAGRVTVPNWHLLFDFEGRRVLEWWPTSGSWWCVVDKTKGKCKDYVEVIDLACRKAGLMETV